MSSGRPKGSPVPRIAAVVAIVFITGFIAWSLAALIYDEEPTRPSATPHAIDQQ